MQVHRHVPDTLDSGNRADVIDVRVRQPDRLERCARSAYHRHEFFRLRARINERRALSRRINDEVAVLLKRTDRAPIDLHAEYPPVPMISGTFSPSANALRYFSTAIAAVVASPTAVVT